MTFPAELRFRRDPTLRPTARRVYEYLTTELDFAEVRAVKGELHAKRCGVNRPEFMRALDVLTERGYLVEHGRDERRVRQLTLAWSINPERRADGVAL